MRAPELSELVVLLSAVAEERSPDPSPSPKQPPAAGAAAAPAAPEAERRRDFGSGEYRLPHPAARPAVILPLLLLRLAA